MLPAPILIIKGFRIRSNNTEAIMEIIMVRIMACTAPLSAFSLRFCPMYLDNALVAPPPRPLPRPTSIKNSGVTNPTPARASLPRPATHAASAKLYILTSSMERIRGTDILRTATRGFPRIIFTPSVFISSVIPIHLQKNTVNYC